MIACETNGPSSEQNKITCSGEKMWSYCGMERSYVEKELTKAGWVQNYSGKTYSGSPVALYVYNRPTGANWRPCHFDKYAFTEQKDDYEALEKLMQNGKIYGEIYMIYGDDVVEEFGLFWLAPSSICNGIDTYKAFSNNIYNAYLTSGGNEEGWLGIINSYNYFDRRDFIASLNQNIEPSIEEYANYRTSSHSYMYNEYCSFDYYSEGTFYISVTGEKY